MTTRDDSTFKLPTTTTIIISKQPSGKVVAHCLDFDLVCSASSEEQAIEKLRLTIKIYVEYGLSNGWEDYISFPAPSRFSDAIADLPATFLPPIQVSNRRMLVVRAETHEPRKVAG